MSEGNGPTLAPGGACCSVEIDSSTRDAEDTVSMNMLSVAVSGTVDGVEVEGPDGNIWSRHAFSGGESCSAVIDDLTIKEEARSSGLAS